MFKLVYLPTAEDVHLYENRPYSREELGRYMGKDFYFNKESKCIVIYRIGSGMLRDRMEAGTVIPKYLLEIIEVPDQISPATLS